MPMAWKFEDDSLYYSYDDKEENFKRLCQRVEIVATHVDIVTGLESVDVKIALGYESEPFRLPSSELTTKKLLENLCGHGLKIIDGDTSARIVKSVLLSTQSDAPTIFEHSKSGFRNVLGHNVFLGYKAYGHPNTKINSSVNIEAKLFEPRGSPKAWRNLLLKYPAKRPNLAVILALGTSSVVAHILKEERVFMETLLWAIIGDSSTGKTSLLYFIAMPFFDGEQAIQSFRATTNAFHEMLRERPGMPFLCDESSHTPNFDWDSIIYEIPRGRAKRRCRGDGSLVPAVNYGGSFVMTSEVSVLSRTLQLPGQRVRLTEFTDDWFQSGEEAEEIRDVASKHYGWGTEPLMNILLSDGFTKKLIKKYQRFYKQLLTETTQRSGMDRRLLQRFAILLASIWLAQKAFRVDMHLEKCIVYLEDFYNRLSEENAAEPAEDKLLSNIAGEIARNNGRFPEEIDVRKNRRNYSSQSIDGLKAHYGNTRCVWISEQVFKPMFNRLCSEDLVSMCKKMHAKGYMVKFYGNRFYKEKSLVVGRTNCYCILFPEDDSITDILDKLNQTQKTTALDVVKAVHNDSYGLFIDRADVDDMVIAKSADELMTVSFEKLGAQQLRMVLNKELYQRLNLSTSERVYVLPIPGKGVMMLSKKELLTDCFFTRLHLMKDGSARSDVRALSDIFNSCDLNLKLYEKIEFTDIAIETIEESPVAVINMINENCMEVSSIGGNPTLMKNNDKEDYNGASFKTNGASKRIDLLSEDPEDDE